MKRILIGLLFLSAITQVQAQDCETFPAVSLSYVIPKTAAVSVDYFTKIGLTTGIGVAYTPVKSYPIHTRVGAVDSLSNSIDMFSFIGWRLYQSDYRVSVFLNAGLVMGDKEPLQPFISTRLLFPLGQRSVSLEPVYVVGRGFTTRLSIHFKI